MGARVLHHTLVDVPRKLVEWLVRTVRERRRRTAHRSVLVWTRVGAVWAMDHTKLDAPIEGELPYLLVVRDLASGCVLSSLPTRSTDQAPVVQELARLFAVFGPPLVLKMDNGSGLVGEDVMSLLDEAGVTALRSPPRTPRYNGAVEAGMGGLKGWLNDVAAFHGRQAAPTRDDLEAALLLQGLALFMKDVAELYAIERKAIDEELDADARRELRRRESLPIATRLMLLTSGWKAHYSLEGKVAAAMKYARGQRRALLAYL